MNIDWQSISSLSSVVLTIFFGILSYVFYRKGIKKKKILITSNSTVLVSEDLSNYTGLQISYNNEEVKTLTSTTITIRNIGNDVIENTDITPSDPIIISTSNKFLSTNGEEYKVVSSNKKVTTSLQKLDDSKLQLSFDFLNPKNELSITILHNGDIVVNGDLKNGNVDKVSNNDNYTPVSRNISSTHNNDEDFNYSKFTDRIFYLLYMTISYIMMMFAIYKAVYDSNIDNDYIIGLLFPMMMFFMMIQIIHIKK